LNRKPIPEIFALIGVVVYFGFFFWGKRRNQRMALSWSVFPRFILPFLTIKLKDNLRV